MNQYRIYSRVCDVDRLSLSTKRNPQSYYDAIFDLTPGNKSGSSGLIRGYNHLSRSSIETQVRAMNSGSICMRYQGPLACPQRASGFDLGLVSG